MRQRLWLGGADKLARLAPAMLMLGAALLLLMAFGAGRASAATVSCGEVITTNTTVENDLTDCPGPGLFVQNDNVTLDLNGHTIDGVGDSAGVTSFAGLEGVTVKNGTIREFGTGVLVASGDSGYDISDLAVSHNRRFGVKVDVANNNTLERITASKNGTGISLVSSNRNRLQRNRASFNRHDGIVLDAESNNSNMENDLVQNTVSRNKEHGILLRGAENNFLKENTINRNLEGIDLKEGTIPSLEPRPSFGNTITDNELFGNNDDGIEISNGVRNTLSGNRVLASGWNGFHLIQGDLNSFEENLALANHKDGFLVEADTTNTGLARNRARRNGDDGIQDDSASTTLTSNKANRNVDYGILAVPGVTDGGGNLAADNGNPVQCRNVLCS